MSWQTILADHLDRWEGLRLEAYRDQGGVWTIGWGHTGPDVKPGMTITRERARELLAADVGWAANAWDSTVKVPANDKMKAAGVSLIFNIGSGGWKSSTALRRLNAGDYEGAAEAMTRWKKVTVNGQKIVSNGLVQRREHERRLFMEGVAELVGDQPSEAPMPTPRPGEAEGGEQKSIASSKTAAGAVTGMAGAAATVAQGFAYIDWRVAVPLILVIGALGFIFINRWLEAQKGEH